MQTNNFLLTGPSMLTKCRVSPFARTTFNITKQCRLKCLLKTGVQASKRLLCIESQSVTEKKMDITWSHEHRDAWFAVSIALQYSAGKKDARERKACSGKKGLQRDEKILFQKRDEKTVWTAVWVFRSLSYCSASRHLYIEELLQPINITQASRFSFFFFSFLFCKHGTSS